jgi:hypothetical protein
MLIHEMTGDECRIALEQADLGRLACVRGDRPYIVPIYFSYDDKHLYGVTTLGQKIEWMRSNPLVCVEVDERGSSSDSGSPRLQEINRGARRYQNREADDFRPCSQGDHDQHAAHANDRRKP